MGFCSGLKEHRISAQQKAPNVMCCNIASGNIWLERNLIICLPDKVIQAGMIILFNHNGIEYEPADHKFSSAKFYETSDDDPIAIGFKILTHYMDKL